MQEQDQASCLKKEPAEVFKAIQSQEISNLNYSSHISIRSGMSKEKYVETIKLLRQHILRGDCYEINYCMDFLQKMLQQIL